MQPKNIPPPRSSSALAAGTATAAAKKPIDAANQEPTDGLDAALARLQDGSPQPPSTQQGLEASSSGGALGSLNSLWRSFLSSHKEGQEIPPLVLTISDMQQQRPFQVLRGQGVCLELTDNPTTATRWGFSNAQPQPKVTVIDDHLVVNGKRMEEPAAGLFSKVSKPLGGRHVTSRYVWDAKDLRITEGKFRIDARRMHGRQVTSEVHLFFMVIEPFEPK